MWLSDLSLLFVPALSVLQLLPLAYFIVVNRLLRFWFRELRAALAADIGLTRHRIDFYFRYFPTPTPGP